MKNEELGIRSEDCWLKSAILPIEKSVFEKLNIPTIDVSSAEAQKIIQGKPLMQILGNTTPLPPGNGTTAAVFSGDTFLAMIEFIDNKWKYGYVNAGN